MLPDSGNVNLSEQHVFILNHYLTTKQWLKMWLRVLYNRPQDVPVGKHTPNIWNICKPMTEQTTEKSGNISLLLATRPNFLSKMCAACFETRREVCSLKHVVNVNVIELNFYRNKVTISILKSDLHKSFFLS